MTVEREPLGYRINGRKGPDVYNSFIGRPQIASIVVETRRSQLTIRVWPVWVPAESRANRMLRNGSSLRSYNDFAGRNGSGHCGDATMPRPAITWSVAGLPSK